MTQHPSPTTESTCSMGGSGATQPCHCPLSPTTKRGTTTTTRSKRTSTTENTADDSPEDENNSTPHHCCEQLLAGWIWGAEGPNDKRDDDEGDLRR